MGRTIMDIFRLPVFVLSVFASIDRVVVPSLFLLRIAIRVVLVHKTMTMMIFSLTIIHHSLLQYIPLHLSLSRISSSLPVYLWLSPILDDDVSPLSFIRFEPFRFAMSDNLWSGEKCFVSLTDSFNPRENWSIWVENLGSNSSSFRLPKTDLKRIHVSEKNPSIFFVW